MVTSLLAQLVKNLPAMQTRVQFLGGEDPLEKEVATHPSILAWRIPWTEKPRRPYVVHGVTRGRCDLKTKPPYNYWRWGCVQEITILLSYILPKTSSVI